MIQVQEVICSTEFVDVFVLIDEPVVDSRLFANGQLTQQGHTVLPSAHCTKWPHFWVEFWCKASPGLPLGSKGPQGPFDHCAAGFTGQYLHWVPGSAPPVLHVYV